MAKNKQGLAYYSVDTDRYQDLKIKRLRKNFGCNGLAVYDYILCEIYRVKGCFLVWDESTAFDVADYLGLKETQVKEIVSYCCVVGLFNKALLTSERVLTSLSIQTRYKDACIRAKRTKIEIPEKYQILQEECDILPEESNKTQEVCPKVKKSKVNNSLSDDEDRIIGPSRVEPLQGYSSSPSLFLDEIWALLSKPESLERPWLSSVGNLYHLDSSALAGYLQEFFAHLRADGVTQKRLSDFKRHFNAWLRIKQDVNRRSAGNADTWDQLLQDAKRLINQ